MHRTCRPALLVLAAVALLAASACSTTVAGSAAATGATATSAPAASGQGDAVAWVDGVCGALLPFVRTVSTEPKIDSNDPGAAVKGLSTYLGGAVTSLDTALSGLKAVGPSPVRGGDEVVSTLTTSLTTFRTSFQEAKTRIDAVDPNDIGQVASALPAAIEPLQQLSKLPDPTAGLQSNPELDRAAQQAPKCQALPHTGG